MAFGSCCIKNGRRYSMMEAKSVEVKGEELGLLVNFEVTQTFYHEESNPQAVTYVFPNDQKMCIYDTTFVVGEEVIKPKLESKEEAKKTYEEAVKNGYTAVYGSNLHGGLTTFKLGNVPPNTDCKVILKVAMSANLTKENSFFIKFPLDVYTPSGSRNCLDIISSNFRFQLQCDKEKVNNVRSNVTNFEFDDKEKICRINDRVKNKDNEHSIIITFDANELVKSSVLVGEQVGDYDTCAITIAPNLEDKRTKSTTEFIFLIDCSGSMRGSSIKKASECLDLFIRSLPVNSYFNIVRFGSRYDKLFDTSVQYNENNINKALRLAKNLRADLGGTRLYEPLKNIFNKQNKFGQRQIFIMTDGEVCDTSRVIEMVSTHSNENRCFTIGIGRGCDAGLVEGIANSSGGKCDFVQEGDSISEKVIPQLESSLHGNLSSYEIHIEGEENDSFQVSPYPLPVLTCKGCCLVYLRNKKKGDKNEFEDKNFLITVNQGNETVDIPVEENRKAEKIDEVKYGCSNGKNIGKSILPLFAFQLLQKYEKKEDISEEEKKNAIELSISSGVLCKYTGYVGISKEPNAQNSDSDNSYDSDSDDGCIIRSGYKRSSQIRGCIKRSSQIRGCIRKSSQIRGCIRKSSQIRGCIRGSSQIRGCKTKNLKKCKMMATSRDDSESSDDDECDTSDDISDDSDSDDGCIKRSGCKGSSPKKCFRKGSSQIKGCIKSSSQSKGCKTKNLKKCKKMASPSDDSESSDDEECIMFDYISDDSDSNDSMPKASQKTRSKMKKTERKPFDLMSLLQSQNFNGYWENLGEINSMLRLNVSKIIGVDVDDEKIANRCVATILALAALHVKSMEKKNLWTMIEIKAIDWLKNTLPEADIDQLIKNTESLIQQ